MSDQERREWEELATSLDERAACAGRTAEEHRAEARRAMAALEAALERAGGLKSQATRLREWLAVIA